MSRRNEWTQEDDSAVAAGVLSGRTAREIGEGIGRTHGAVSVRITHLRKAGSIPKVNITSAEIAAQTAVEERKRWKRAKKRAFADKCRLDAKGSSYAARMLGCSVREVRELLAECRKLKEQDAWKDKRTRSCSRCHKVFTTPHKCRFLCDSCNSYASSMGW